jgi:hypothetical protein
LNYRLMATAAAILMAVSGTGALAQDFGKPMAVGEGVTLDPIIDANLRYEHVEQAGIANEADAVTFRLRLGGEVKLSGFSLLAEGEGTLALADGYNDTLPGNGAEPYPVVADPENIELNRLQLAYSKDGYGITVGRQRIIHDNSRFVGNVGWRQNEQTFDAVRATAKLGPVSLDAAYSISQRTIFGVDSPNEYFDGDLVLLNGSVDVKPVKLSTFAYLIDYDTRLAFSSQTYGARATGSFKLGVVGLDLMASIASQSDMGGNPTSYSAEYYALEAGGTFKGFTVKGGYEELGSDGGAAAFQTPLATLHAFNGWADLFLTTPAAGLRDYYVGGAYKFAKVKALPGLNVAVTWHRFESDIGGADYGDEINASVGFKLGPLALLAKYADYDADGFGADVEKLWLQAAISY